MNVRGRDICGHDNVGAPRSGSTVRTGSEPVPEIYQYVEP